MKYIGKKILLLTLAIVLLGACSDDLSSGDGRNANQTTENKSGENLYGNVPITFRVNNIVSAEVTSASTRAGWSDANAEPSLAGEQIGLFVLIKSDYERVTQGSDPISDYHYYNVQGTVDVNGGITVNTPMFFPITRDSKIAVVAYYPYDAGKTENILYNGIPWQLKSDQTSSEDFYASDLLIGLPTDGNPIEYASEEGVTTPIELTFKHKCTRVVVDVKIPTTVVYNTVEVSIGDIPLQATINPWDGSVSSSSYGESGTIKMLEANYADGTDGDDTKSFKTTAIVLPREGNAPTIGVTLKDAEGETLRTISRHDVGGTTYASGGNVNYSVTISATSE